MDTPQRLADWDLPAIQRLVEQDAFESDRFDFKVDLSLKDGGVVIRAAACALANSKGGFLIFGVSEKGTGLERIVGIPHSRETLKQIGDRLQGIEPSISTETQDSPIKLENGKELLILEIHKGRRGPHWDSEKKKFWKRGQSAKEEMPYDEVRMAFADYDERVSRLRLVFLSLIDNWVRLEDIVRHQGGAGPLPFSILDLSQVRSFLGDVQSVQPGLVEEVFVVLREGDSIAARCTQMFMVQRGTASVDAVVTYHKNETRFAMERLKPRIQRVLEVLQKTCGFESVSPRGPHGPKMPPLP